MERLGNLSSSYARWEEMTWGFLLVGREGVTWVRARLYNMMVEREARGWSVKRTGGNKAAVTYCEQGTGDLCHHLT